MGRKRVLSDFQREKRRYARVLKWQAANKEKLKAWYREYWHKNREKRLQQKREYQARVKRRMLEDAFERVMDRKDGFEITITIPKGLTHKQHCKAYYQKHRDELLRKRSEYRKNNREKYNAYHCAWYAKHKKPKGVKLKTPRVCNWTKEQQRESARKHYLKNREKIKAKVKAYQKRNREKYNTYQRERRKTKALIALQSEPKHTLV